MTARHRAHWAPTGGVEMSLGPDPDGFGFCALCGEPCTSGVVVRPVPCLVTECAAFFCGDCSRKIGEAAKVS